ncbi:uncharacterized protein LOC131216896 [Magnolia sinica]|uniref:uncharacterized protein LOC131216896 n=1 Tax=Magnolia sinica TaxID=86752 RepID=UPI002659E151|nr:uncharacterized protein LOC131216896 [Magnolia sinica]
MGSSSSRMSSRPSRRTRVNRGRSRFASFFCATSLPHNDAEMEDHLAEVLVSSGGDHGSTVDDYFRRSVKEASSISSSENECSSSTSGNGASGESSNGTQQAIPLEYGLGNLDTIDAGKGLSESKELVPCQEDACYRRDAAYFEGTSHIASTTKELQPPESAAVNPDVRLASVSEVDVATSERGSTITEGFCSSSIPQQEVGQPHEDGPSSAENHSDDMLGVNNSSSNSVSAVSDSSASWHSFGDESVRDAAAPGLGFLLPTISRDQRNGSVLHVDVVSISSNILPSSTGDISSRDARRNSRRLFWDAFSRRSSRRLTDSPTIVFSTEDTDDLGSHDRWLLDFSGELFDNGVGDDSGFLNSRRHGTYERRRQSRSEIWDRLRRDLDENSGRTAYCASGLHPDGTCSCEAFLVAEESGTRASISRIVLLAEALFEVLDEIHRQPVSLSLSMLSVPAPESVVDSFPLKSHKKPAVPENGDLEQCYICLAEYDEGDKIRVLPCRHEYHMLCVDKWLKEIHGVCPLCRGDVCAGAAESSVSNA